MAFGRRRSRSRTRRAYEARFVVEVGGTRHPCSLEIRSADKRQAKQAIKRWVETEPRFIGKGQIRVTKITIDQIG
jgi:hypothetical protein